MKKIGISFRAHSHQVRAACHKRYGVSLAAKLGIEPYEAAVTGDALCRLLLGEKSIIEHNINQSSEI